MDQGRQIRAAKGADSFVDYLRKHGVSVLMEDMLRHLAVERPADPESALREILKKRVPDADKGGAEAEGNTSTDQVGGGLDILRDAFQADLSNGGPEHSPGVGAGSPSPSRPKPIFTGELDEAAVSKRSTVLAVLGPVIGKVTENSANVLLEVDQDCELTCVATPAGLQRPTRRSEVVDQQPSPKNVRRRSSALGDEDGPEDGWAVPKVEAAAARCSRRVVAGRPHIFVLEGLTADSRYDIDFIGISMEQRRLFDRHGGCSVRTLPADAAKVAGSLRVIALSCDRPNRLMSDEGEINPWDEVARRCVEGSCDLVLHVGDQVYTCMNDHLEWCYRYYELMERTTNESMKEKLREKSVERLRDAYRDTWTFPGVRKALAHASHLMLWSDNDVANDFTVLKSAVDPSKQAYPAGLLRCAMDVYREYQRQLWDIDMKPLKDPVEEWHFHMYGRVGIFMMDMRGARIDAGGNQLNEPIITQAQKQALVDAFKTPDMSCMLLCSEIPYVGDDPKVIHEKAKKFVFLEDHWPYHEDDLIFILDQCFDWRAAGKGREVVMIAGDIHVGVESTIDDKRTGASIKSITASPITNHVCSFFPALKGTVGERYSYEHKVLKKKRNFCSLDISWEEDGSCKAEVQLEGFHTLSSLEEERKKKGAPEETFRHKGVQPTQGNEASFYDWLDGGALFGVAVGGKDSLGSPTSPLGGLRRRSSCPAASFASVKNDAKWFGRAGRKGSEWFSFSRQPVLDRMESRRSMSRQKSGDSAKKSKCDDAIIRKEKSESVEPHSPAFTEGTPLLQIS